MRKWKEDSDVIVVSFIQDQGVLLALDALNVLFVCNVSEDRTPSAQFHRPDTESSAPGGLCRRLCVRSNGLFDKWRHNREF